ncbi:hypothetical protein J6590_075498, partial [Homalodisca vitripennis]
MPKPALMAGGTRISGGGSKSPRRPDIRYFIKADNLSVYEYYTGINVPRVWSLVRGGFGRHFLWFLHAARHLKSYCRCERERYTYKRVR